MGTEKLDKDIVRLATIVAEDIEGKALAEGIGIAIGLFGLAVKSLCRIADALEKE